MPVARFLGQLQNVTPVAVAAVAGAAPAGRSGHLAVSIEKQVPSEWCWAATVSAISTFYALVRNIGDALTPCQVATQIIGQQCCPAPTDPSDPRNYEFDMEVALNGVNPSHLGRGPIARQDPSNPPMSFADIMTEIDGQRPIVCRIAWDPNNLETNGHYNAIVGYDAANQDVDVRDCLYDDTSMPLSIFATSYRDQGIWHLAYLTV